MSKDTRFELVDELKKLPEHRLILEVMLLAVNGEYHDFKNKQFAMPKVMLIKHLEQIRDTYPELADQVKLIEEEVKDGEYDEQADEEDQQMIANVINTDPEMTARQKNNLKEVVGLKDNVRNGPFGKRYF